MREIRPLLLIHCRERDNEDVEIEISLDEGVLHFFEKRADQIYMKRESNVLWKDLRIKLRDTSTFTQYKET